MALPYVSYGIITSVQSNRFILPSCSDLLPSGTYDKSQIRPPHAKGSTAGLLSLRGPKKNSVFAVFAVFARRTTVRRGGVEKMPGGKPRTQMDPFILKSSMWFKPSPL